MRSAKVYVALTAAAALLLCLVAGCGKKPAETVEAATSPTATATGNPQANELLKAQTAQQQEMAKRQQQMMQQQQARNAQGGAK